MNTKNLIFQVNIKVKVNVAFKKGREVDSVCKMHRKSAKDLKV